jgi:restriction system protein
MPRRVSTEALELGCLYGYQSARLSLSPERAEAFLADRLPGVISLGLRKPLSSSVLSHQGDRGTQIGAVKHPPADHSVSARRSEAHDKNEALRAIIHALDTILETGIARDAHVGVGDWRRAPTLADLPADLRDLTPPDSEHFKPQPLGLLERLSPDARARHAEATEAGAARYRDAVADWERAQARQVQAIEALRVEIEAQNGRLAELERALKAGEPAAVEWYASEVLKKSPYPKRLERRIEVGLDPKTATLTVKMGIPEGGHVVPAVEAFKYVKPTDEIREVDRSPGERSAIYDRVVAQLVLRSLHEIFSSDDGDAISRVALSVEVVAVDPSTGHDTILPLLSLAVARSAFDAIDLARVEAIACLHRLVAPAS